MAGERPVLQQHQTRAGGTVIMLNEHFFYCQTRPVSQEEMTIFCE